MFKGCRDGPTGEVTNVKFGFQIDEHLQTSLNSFFRINAVFLLYRTCQRLNMIICQYSNLLTISPIFILRLSTVKNTILLFSYTESGQPV